MVGNGMEPQGGALLTERRYRALFLAVSKLPHSNWNQKHCRDDCHGVCISDSVVCSEARIASMHTLRCIYILLRGCFSVCLFQLAVVGHEQRTGRCKHPRFLVCSQSIMKYGCPYGCLADAEN